MFTILTETMDVMPWSSTDTKPKSRSDNIFLREPKIHNHLLYSKPRWGLALKVFITDSHHKVK